MQVCTISKIPLGCAAIFEEVTQEAYVKFKMCESIIKSKSQITATVNKSADAKLKRIIMNQLLEC